MDKVKLMPPAGWPKTEHFQVHPTAPMQKAYASQLKPYEATDEATVAELRKRGWVDWQPHETPSLADLAPERETVRMRAPANCRSVIVKRAESGDEVLYPGGGTIEADPADRDALKAQGFVDVLTGSALPSARGVDPGTRFEDAVSGLTYTRGADAEWIEEAASNG